MAPSAAPADFVHRRRGSRSSSPPLSPPSQSRSRSPAARLSRVGYNSHNGPASHRAGSSQYDSHPYPAAGTNGGRPSSSGAPARRSNRFSPSRSRSPLPARGQAHAAAAPPARQGRSRSPLGASWPHSGGGDRWSPARGRGGSGSNGGPGSDGPVTLFVSAIGVATEAVRNELNDMFGDMPGFIDVQIRYVRVFLFRCSFHVLACIQNDTCG